MSTSVLQLLQLNNDLPPMPDIVQQIDIKIKNPETSLVDVAKMIETEPVLTGRILKLANSVKYSGGRSACKSLAMACWQTGSENSQGIGIFIRFIPI